MLKTFTRIIKSNSGATAIEYGLIAALIGVAIITSAGLVGNNISDVFTKVSDELTNALK